MLANREGRFRARIVERSLTESGKNKLACFVANFLLLEELRGNAWEPVEPDLTIRGYFYLETVAGGINEVTVGRLKDALGWDGRDVLWLQDADLSAVVVQVKLAEETWDGKTRLKVQYLDPGTTRPRTLAAPDDATRRSVSNRLGGKLRAVAGAASAPAAKPAATAAVPAARPPAAAPVKPPAPAAPPVSPADDPRALMELAWAAVVDACPAKWTPEQIGQEWFRILGEMFPGTAPERLTAAQWAAVRDEAPGKVVPF